MRLEPISIDELEGRLREVIAHVSDSDDAYVVTGNGEPAAVLLPYASYAALAADAANGHPGIERVPGVQGGRPVVRGTRIPVQGVVLYMEVGLSVEGILEAYPTLTAAQVHAALAYYYDHRDEIDQLIEESRPERVLADNHLVARVIAPGVAEIHDADGRW
jgi:prevent-host-death family protein